MRIGLFASTLSLMAMTAVPSTLAQSPYGPPGRPAAAASLESGAVPSAPAPANGPIQALYLSAGHAIAAKQTPYVDAHGNPVVMPVGYQDPAACYPGQMPMGYGGACPPAGDHLMNDVGIDGFAPDQHGPHYFDVRAEYVFMTPDTTFGQEIDFTAEDINGPIVLSSRQLDFGFEPGFRVVGRYDLGPLSLFEFGYMGIYDWNTSAFYRDPDEGEPGFAPDLYSLFSLFGTDPDDVSTGTNPIPQTEQSLMHTIRLDADFHNAEASYRRYWAGFNPRISGTLLAGFRYTKYAEEFHFSAFSDDASFDYGLDIENDLAGFQTGGDIWICLAQGLRIGAEGKVGIYNNHLTLENAISATPEIDSDPEAFPAVPELFRLNQAAFISEASVDVVADVLPSWSLRAGYEIIYINSIALAGENFNTGPPYPEVTFDEQTPRVPFLADQGHALFHGFHAGVEYIW